MILALLGRRATIAAHLALVPSISVSLRSWSLLDHFTNGWS